MADVTVGLDLQRQEWWWGGGWWGRSRGALRSVANQGECQPCLVLATSVSLLATNHSGTLLHISDVAQLTAQQKKSSVGDNLNIGTSSAVLLSLQQEISDHMMSWTRWVFASGA